jgi:hypothetical protein
MEREEQRGQTAPPLQNANKANMIKKRGQEPIRLFLQSLLIPTWPEVDVMYECHSFDNVGVSFFWHETQR